MKILNIKINKIFSIGHIDSSLEDLGLVLITGYSKDEGSANGSGKSSFVRNSLIWGLYGKVLNDAQGDDVVNTHTDGKDAYVEISFEGSDGKIYHLRRSRNPHKVEISNSKGSISVKTGTQELIDSLLGRDYKTFIQTDVFGQGRKESFMDLTATNQRNIVENMLGFGDLSSWEDRAKTHRMLSEAEIVLQEKIIANLKGKLDGINIESLETMESSWEQSVKDEMKAIQNFIAKNVDLLEKSSEYEKTINDNIEDTYKAGAEYLDNLAESELYVRDIEGKISRVKERIKIQEEQRIKLTSLSDANCPTCSQKVPYNLVSKAIQVSYFETSELDTKCRSLMVDRNKEQKRIEDALQCKKKILGLNSKLNDAIMVGLEISNSINQKKERLKDIQNQKNPYSGLKEDLTKQRDAIQIKLHGCIANLSELETERDRLSYWVNTYGKNMKIYFMEQACPFLEEKINNYLRLLNNEQISVSVSTQKELKSGKQKEDLSITAKSRTGGSSYFLLSGGEQQMVNFAINLALSDLAEQQVSGPSEICILDEPFTNLDSRNCENVIEFITQHLQDRKSTILFVSNEEGLKELVPKRLHIEKENGVSSLRV